MSISSYPFNTSLGPICSHTSPTHRISLCSSDRHVKIVAWTSYYVPSCCRYLIWCYFCIRVVRSMDKRVEWLGSACRGDFPPLDQYNFGSNIDGCFVFLEISHSHVVDLTVPRHIHFLDSPRFRNG